MLLPRLKIVPGYELTLLPPTPSNGGKRVIHMRYLNLPVGQFSDIIATVSKKNPVQQALARF